MISPRPPRRYAAGLPRQVRRRPPRCRPRRPHRVVATRRPGRRRAGRATGGPRRSLQRTAAHDAAARPRQRGHRAGLLVSGADKAPAIAAWVEGRPVRRRPACSSCPSERHDVDPRSRRRRPTARDVRDRRRRLLDELRVDLAHADPAVAAPALRRVPAAHPRRAFEVGGAGPVHEFLDSFGNRRQRVVMPTGPSRIMAEARVDVADHLDVDMTAPRVPIDQLPDDATQFLLPSRYCPSDLVFDSAIEITRGALPGYPQVEAIRAWIASEIRYEYGASHMSTSALDTLESRRGVCRDFAHLGISLCRAIDIPARMVAGYLHELEPMDAHAWFEAFVGHRWFSFDATQAVPRGQSGRDRPRPRRRRRGDGDAVRPHAARRDGVHVRPSHHHPALSSLRRVTVRDRRDRDRRPGRDWSTTATGAATAHVVRRGPRSRRPLHVRARRPAGRSVEAAHHRRT